MYILDENKERPISHSYYYGWCWLGEARIQDIASKGSALRFPK